MSSSGRINMSNSNSKSIDHAKDTVVAYCHFDASNGTPVIKNSYNIASITDSGVGSYVMVYVRQRTNNFPIISFDSSQSFEFAGAITSASCAIEVRNVSNNAADTNLNHFTMFGGGP